MCPRHLSRFILQSRPKSRYDRLAVGSYGAAMRIAKGVLLCGALLVATPEFAQASLPNPLGEPECGKPNLKSTDPKAKPSDIPIWQPIIYYPFQALEFFLAVEQAVEGGRSRLFFPVVKYEEHRNWVRVYRVSGRKDGKPIRPAKFEGKLVYPSVGERSISMRIDKCDARVSEVKYILPRRE